MCRALSALPNMLSCPAEEQCHCTIQRYGLKAGRTFLVNFAYCSCRPFLMYCRWRNSVTVLIPAHGGKCTRERLIPLVNALQCSGHVSVFPVNPVAFTWFSTLLRNRTCIFYAPESLFLVEWAVLWPEGHLEWYIYIYMIWYDIFNCNWVASRWQQYSTHLHTNNTQNNTIDTTIHRTTQLTNWEECWPCLILKMRVIPWHFPYNWGKSTEIPQWR
jgi:hypothetical protein